MKARRPVSTTRDYRPPSAGAPRTTGAPAGATRGGSVDPDAAEAAEHDKAVRPLADHTVTAAAVDLCRRRVANRRDPEARWTLSRRAALLRELIRRRLPIPAHCHS